MDDTKWLRLRDVTNRYSVAKSTIYRWMASEDFPRPVKIGGSCARWSVEALDAYDAMRAAA